MFEEDKARVCNICNSLIFEDGTADNCCGECDRELTTELSFAPLSFDDDDVIRELPAILVATDGEEYTDE